MSISERIYQTVCKCPEYCELHPTGSPRPVMAIRGSGCMTQIVCWKCGPNMLAQAAKMRLRTDVYAPVLGVYENLGGFIEESYIMPVLRPLCSSLEIVDALNLLAKLWKHATPKWQEVTRSRANYYKYVRNLPADGLLMNKLDALWVEAREETHALYCTDVHGDATLENCMWSEEANRPYWMDPCARTVPCAAPLEAEVDCGKLLQSVHGYHTLPMRTDIAVQSFLKVTGANPALTRFYFASHLVRLWRHQTDKRDWALEVARTWL